MCFCVNKEQGNEIIKIDKKAIKSHFRDHKLMRIWPKFVIVCTLKVHRV